jgi:N-acetylmuramoyl-L-alanine amidase CwlA
MKKYIFDYSRKAKNISYGGTRSRKDIEGIVIHNTGNVGDTAKNNADYFATGNTRSAGAHIFIDGNGLTAYSVPLTRIAYAVGNPKGAYTRGLYYATLNNANTISIELCDIVNHGVTDAQLTALIRVVSWLKIKCPNIRHIVRHYDIVQKDCPTFYVQNKTLWKKLRTLLLSYIKGE